MNALLIGIGSFFLVFAIAFFGGTIVWILWDDCIPHVFPSLVENGHLAADLSWWQAVSLTWLSGLLIKGSSSTIKS